MREHKRISIFTGHFGSGKTEVAINYALKLKERHEKVAIVDFDVVNPYFRTKDAEEFLTAKGIKVIASQFANSNIENPALPAEINMIFENRDYYAVFDVGGDDDGATPLGRYRSGFLAEDYEMFFVLNERRIITDNLDGALDIFYNIETASRLKISSIINNTHLKQYSTIKNILDGQKLAEQVSEKTGVPIKYICGTSDILAELPQEYEKMKFPLDLFLKLNF